jgi:hypothetical protein
MANLQKLLNDRANVNLRSVETLAAGPVYYYTFTDTQIGRCQFCYKAPGTGCVALEVWGSAGSGGRQCCCTMAGLPGNAPGYSKKFIRVCSGTYICGWAGCSHHGLNLCTGCRGNCTVACVFNSGNNGCARGEGGYGGWTRCITSGTPYCCLRACNFCATQEGSSGCGIICNYRGPQGAVPANGSSGDVNYNGCFSCTRYWCCCRGYQLCGVEHRVSIAAGIHSSDGPSSLQFQRNQAPTNNGSGGSTGRAEMQIAHAGFGQTMPQMDFCWQGTRECGCYDALGCYFGTPGIPGTSGVGCAGVRSQGMRGGHGAVKVTFYS